MNEQIEALITANEYMTKLKNGINSLVNYMENGEEDKGLLLIPYITEGIEWIVEIVFLTRDVHKTNIDVSNINDKLNEILMAIENEDYILVCDLFNYEVLPILENIHKKIKEIVLN